MSKFDNNAVRWRYLVIAVVLTFLGVAVVGKALYIMTAEKDYWTIVQKQTKRDSIPVNPTRGNILSCDGQLMASSIPEYKVFIDFQPGKIRDVPADTADVRKLRQLWDEKMDSLCIGLHEIFPQQSAEKFKAHLMKGRHKINGDGSVGARHWPVWKSRIDYNTFTLLRKLPIFKLPVGVGGFHWEEFNARNRPFGSLAQRTVGIMYGEIDSARCGLELSFDSILRGTQGLKHSQKILNKVMNITEVMPVDGADIVTTIDVGMQDLAERSLIDEMNLPEVNADLGVAILMEVSTGDVKAIVNLARMPDGQLAEAINSAISYRCEPGSVFKVASVLVALDDEVADTSFMIHTGCGVLNMHGRLMKDHNWRKGKGFGDINLARTLEVSSNIGTSATIDRFYGDHPEKYVEGLYRIGIHDDLKLPLVGYRPPIIRMPDTKTSDRAKYWSKTTLPWMSIGYETQIAPINTITFYNAIANNGKMMQPRFVSKLVKDGKTIREFPPVVLREQITRRKETISKIQTILEHVVSQGLGSKAAPLSKAFKVAGKTGTAQIADEHGGYHSGVTRYWLSFAGFFPADNPRYSCIVCLRKRGLPASGGGMSGVVFRHIAEGVMAQNVKWLAEYVKDSTSDYTPTVKGGNNRAARQVLRSLSLKGKQHKLKKTPRNIVPDVTGMGARDAVYELERRGLRVTLRGCGKVKSQSLSAGKVVVPGTRCELKMEI
jgi:cell division protein FtsI (penicillin-binding protein 3)